MCQFSKRCKKHGVFWVGDLHLCDKHFQIIKQIPINAVDGYIKKNYKEMKESIRYGRNIDLIDVIKLLDKIIL